MSGDSGEESPQRTKRRLKIFLRSSSDSDSDSSFETIGLGRRKRLRVVASDEDSADSADSSESLLVVDASSRRTLPQLRYDDESRSSSHWETDHSDHETNTKYIKEKLKPKQTKDACASDSSDGNSEKCPICLLSFHDQEIGTPETCEHVFCVDCITEWSKNVNTCPVDRMNFDSIIVRRCMGGRVLRKIPVVNKPVPEEILPIQEDPTYCEICRSSEREDSMLLCDMCDLGYHMQCLAPPMIEIPVGEWFCPHCAIEDYEEVYMSEVEDILADSDEIGHPSGPRPSILRRVTHNNRLSTRFQPNSLRNLGEPSTSGNSQRFSHAGPSTSRRQTAGNSRVTTTRRRKTKRKTKRTRTVVGEYEIKDENKFPVKKKVPVRRRVKRKKVKKRRAPRTVARRSLVRASVRARLATLHTSQPDTALTITHRGPDALTLSRYKAGIPSLRLLGTGNELDYFSDDEEMSVGDGPNAVATRRQTTSQAIQDMRQARRKMIGIPRPSATISGVDILSGIIQSQTLLHSKNAKVSINSDGTLKIDEKPQKNTKKEKESSPDKSSDGKLDLTKGEGATKKTPAYGGTSSGGGNWNGNRGGFSRDQNTYNNRGGGNGSSYSNNGGNGSYQGGGNPSRGNYQGGENYTGNTNYPNFWQSNPNLRSEPDGGNLMDINRRRDQNSDRRDQSSERRNQLPDRRDMFPERHDQFPERRNQFHERHDQFPERRDPFQERRVPFPERLDPLSERRSMIPDRPLDHNNMLHRAMLNANRELHSEMYRDIPVAPGGPQTLGRASLGAPWQPFATNTPFNPLDTMARHSFGGFDNSDPLDMTVGQNTNTQGDVDDREIDIYGDMHEAPVQPELHTHIEPLPEPPVFRFDPKHILSEDEKSDSGLVIDTEKYDPMDPTNDESSSDEDEVHREKGDPHKMVGLFGHQEQLTTAGNSSVIVPPKILDAAVQQVLTQVHRDMITSNQSHDSDGDDSEGDCPNYSIYSAASLNIANNNESTIIVTDDNLQNIDEHEEKEEDLIQQEDDIPEPSMDEKRVKVTFKEPEPLDKQEEIKKSVEEDKLDEKVSKRCPITPNKRTAIKIKLNAAPTLIKRHVLDLYADEDELIEDEEKIFDKPPLALENLLDKTAEDDSSLKDDKTREHTAPTELAEDNLSDDKFVDIAKEGHVVLDEETPAKEAPDGLSLEDVSPGKVTSDDEFSEKEDGERDSSESGSKKGSTENSFSASDSRKKSSGEKISDELSSSMNNSPENNLLVTDICENYTPKTDLKDENTENIVSSVNDHNKMTESISGSEDERSYTPCLDENKSKDTSLETDKENILEALGTEMISEDEENEIFSDHSDQAESDGVDKPDEAKMHTDKEHSDKEYSDKEHTDKEQRDEEPTEVALADKKKKKKKIDKDWKDKGKVKGKKAEIPFKKLSKSSKERNYRDKDDKNKSRRKRSDEKDKEIKSSKEKRKEKRKDLERYDVRNVVSDKKRKVKDPFGRDTSRPRSHSRSLSRTPSPTSFSARHRTVSAPRYTPSLGRGRSPPPRSISTKLQSPRRSLSPRNRKLFSPIPRSPSPRRKRLASPREPSRKRKSVSPRRRSVSPRRRSVSPRRRSVSPRQRSVSPKRRSVSPQVRRSLSTRRRKSFSPKVRKSISPRRGRSISHKERKSPPHARKSLSPTRRRRSTSRRRKRVRRSPSPKPRKKISRKSRSRLRSSSRRRSPKGKKSRRIKQLRNGSGKRKSPKGKKTKRRSVTPVNVMPHSPSRAIGRGPQQGWQKSPAYHEDWSSDSPSLNSRMLSPGLTPPRGETPERRNLRVIVTNPPKDKRKREKRKRAKDLDTKNQHDGPSKEVFTSGNNILVSVNFNQQEDRISPPPEDPRKRKRDTKKDNPKEKMKRRRKKDNETTNAKPIAIIDLDKSPFREITPSPKNVIVLSDSEHEDKEEEPSMRPPLLQGEPDQINSGTENAATTATFLSTGGPKTPPEPSVKFSIVPIVNPQLRAGNPLHEEEEDENVDNATTGPVNKDSHKGPNTPPDPPNTPPSSPDAYDPFEPTKSGSASPAQSESKETDLGNKQDIAMTLESAQSANLSADDVVNSRPITPIEKVMALLKSTQNVSPTDPNQEEQAVEALQQAVEMTNSESQAVQADNTIAVLINKTAQPISHFSAVIKPNSPKLTYSTVAPTVTSSAPVYLNSAIPRIGAFSGTSQSPVRNPSTQLASQRIVLPSPTKSSPLRTQPNKLFLAKPSPIKSTPIKPMPSKTIISKLPLPSIKPVSRKHNRMDNDDYDMGMDNDYVGMDSPYSPGSSDFGDLFEPPTDKSGKSSFAKQSTKDDLFGSSKNSKGKGRSSASKVPVKQIKKKGKTQTVGVKMDDENLKIMDDLPSSAVEMQVKSKFLNKLNRQSRVVEEVKLVLKPHYNKKHVTKEQYKDILRSAVPKICHNRNGEINPAKIQLLVEAYVKKYRKRKLKNV